MKGVRRIGLVVVLGSALACGQSPEETQAEAAQESAAETQKSADAVQKGAEDMAKGIEAMARGMGTALGGTTADGKAVDPVDFKLLQAAIPDVSGWERSKPTGERMTLPVRFSQATAKFTKGDARIEQKITDSALNQLLMAPFTMVLAAGYSKETSEGFERSVTIAGSPALEKWDSDARRGELTVVINKRFLVELEGRGLSSDKDLRDFIAHTDLKRVAELQ
jgi:hypothetical protein